MKTLCVIPARYGSRRFPGKPLALLAGKPLVQHVFERARQATQVDDLLVATDDQRILEAVQAFGGRAVLTSPHHCSGTDRVAEVAEMYPCSLVVNVQGDEPLIDPGDIDQVVEMLSQDPQVDISSLMVPIKEERELFDPNVVKVVVDAQGWALYFSRAPIPFPRDGWRYQSGVFFRHIGLYGYRRAALLKLASLGPCPLEEVEKLEQLRALNAGLEVKLARTSYAGLGIDTPEELARLEEMMGR